MHFIPISALLGDNVVDPSANMPWYDGSTLMHLLENVYIGSDRNLEDFRFPVQYVNRPHLEFPRLLRHDRLGHRSARATRSWRCRRGRRAASSRSSRSTANWKRPFAPLAVTLTLEDEIDVSRGDMIVRPGNVPRSEQKFDAMIVWMDEEPMVPGKQYLFKQTTKIAAGTISTLRYRVDVNTLHRSDAPTLQLNEIGRCRSR